MKRFLRASVLAVAIAGLIAPIARAEQPVTVGYENPESAAYHKGTWFVSNVGGYTLEATVKDGDGYISKTGPDDMAATRWVTGLNSPKGMRVHKNLLWVADVDEVVAIDIASGKIVRKVTAKGAVFLNDVGVDPANGDVYATDTFGDKIWRISGNKASVFLSSPKLEAPNGILVEKGQILIGSFGTNVDQSTFQTEELGRVLSVDRSTKKIRPLTERIGNLDGLERDGRDLIVTDFWGGQILRVLADGTTEVIARTPPSAADIGWDPKSRTVALPHLALNYVSFHQL